MKKRQLLYVGCLGYGNAGDEACLEGTRLLFENLLPSDWEFTWLNGYDFRGDEDFDALILGGGTLLSPHGNLGDAALLEARRRGVPYFIFATGLESPEWEGLPEPRLVADFVELVSGASLIGVRGPLSRAYLCQLGLAPADIRVVGDAAVLLKEVKTPAPIDSMRPWLGVNVGTSFGRVFGRDEHRLQEVLVEALFELMAEGWGICLFPVWDRDLEIQQNVERKLKASAGARLSSVETTLEPVRIIGMLSNFEVVLAMKLHAGILSAVAGTPYIPWAYRPKVNDFSSLMGLERLVVRTDAGPKDLIRAVHRAQHESDSIRECLLERVETTRRELHSFATAIVDSLPWSHVDATGTTSGTGVSG
jgi:polysaccharide pyruvyl transferase WcaK-like protein